MDSSYHAGVQSEDSWREPNIRRWNRLSQSVGDEIRSPSLSMIRRMTRKEKPRSPQAAVSLSKESEVVPMG